MQKTNFDSGFCGNLPIHHINTIQPHGAVILVDKHDLTVVQVSVNIVEYFLLEVQEIIGRKLDDLTGLSIEDFLQGFGDGKKKRISLKIEPAHHTMSAWIMEHTHYYFIEIQPESDTYDSKFSGVQEVRELVDTLDTTNELQEACDLIVVELKRMLGIDGVMMYKFDADWNGTVISEVKTNGLEPYLGVTFPASDVPKQARELYLRNPIRLIPNRKYEPARLYPVINPLTNAFTDLSTCFLRGVSDVHLEYLRNMGVVGSMSLRVLHNGKLWGLISCNHSSPYELSFEDCTNLALLTNVISTKISSIINSREYQFVSNLQRDRNTIIDNVYKLGLEKGLFDGPQNILNLFDASGTVLFSEGKQFHRGSVPNRDFLDNIFLWLQAKNINQVYSTHHLVGDLEEAEEVHEITSGMLVIPISNRGAEYIVCFRPEFIKTIEWGGNPHETVNFEEGGLVYHPRNSFKIWMETVHQTAKPWHEQELQIANSIRSFLLEHDS
ncbi:GAF domain-containing protein [Sphingobacterium sp. LRF_L2]|uniref:GAF domain-containing protein n=1 Tax=Sphingobacterium sp. LRF_L2 TaxID=3369421 RepID=UPI003F634B89